MRIQAQRTKNKTIYRITCLLLSAVLTISYLTVSASAEQANAQEIFSWGRIDYSVSYPFWGGLSGYPRTVSGVYGDAAVDDVIAKMNENNLSVYRMSVSSAIDATPYVRRFLEQCNYTLILDYYHQYPPGIMTNEQWNDTTNKALSYLSTFSMYQDRLWLEPFNERYNDDLAMRIQIFILTIRMAGYSCSIVANKSPVGVAPNQTWASMATIMDPANNFWTGIHTYFDPASGKTVANQIAEMNEAKSYGLKLFNTEVGAELGSSLFTTTNVGYLNDYLNFLNDEGIGATIWMYQATQYLDRYFSLGLQFP